MMTNADKIRSMNDEELDGCLDKILSGGFEWFWAQVCNICKAEHGGKCPAGDNGPCTNIGWEILDWLKAEAEN